MEKRKTLIEYIKNVDQLTKADLEDLRNITEKYPYFTIAHILLAKTHYKQFGLNDENTDEIKKSMHHLNDAQNLNFMLASKTTINPAPSTTLASPKNERNTIPIEKTKATSPKASSCINAYLDHIVKTLPTKTMEAKNKKDYTQIKNIIENNVLSKKIDLNSINLEDNQIDLTAEVKGFNDGLVTETLAQILLNQGKIEQALKIYGKLIVKFPEKKSYFANLYQKIIHNV